MSDTLNVQRHSLKLDRPSDLHFSIVLAQPSIRLEQGLGYYLIQETPPQENGWLPTALRVAKERSATFAVFPEYSLPWSSWRELDRQLREELPSNSIVIAGLDSIPQNGYRELLSEGFSVGPDNATELSLTEWANCCVVLAKDREGRIARYLQLKTAGAEAESCAATMARGKSLLVFEATDFCFAVLICYDLMSKLGSGTQLTKWLTTQQKLRNIPPLDLLFAIQHNTNPEHPSFLDGMQELLRAGRVDTVVAVNTAEAGFSGLYFPHGQLKVPPAVAPDSYSLEKIDGREVVRARFRTSSHAVFSFDYHPPMQNQGGGEKVPLVNVCETDPRSSSNGVYRGHPVAPLTWALREYGGTRNPRRDAPGARHASRVVQEAFEGHFEEVYRQLLALDIIILRNVLRVLFAVSGKLNPEPCHWRGEERLALSVLVRMAAILRFGGDLNFAVQPNKVTVELPWAGGRKVAVISGDRTLPLRTCANAFVSEVEAKGGLVCGGCLLVVADHRDQGGPKPTPITVQTAAQAQLAAMPRLATLDSGGRAPPVLPAGEEQPTYSSPDVVLYTYSGGGLESVLAASQTPEQVAAALKEVLS